MGQKHVRKKPMSESFPGVGCNIVIQIMGGYGKSRENDGSFSSLLRYTNECVNISKWQFLLDLVILKIYLMTTAIATAIITTQSAIIKIFKRNGNIPPSRLPQN